ncbi:branched-chain amino acid ABC transporter permease, partial [Ilumatobacter sp.]
MDWGSIIESLFRGLIGESFIVFALAAIGLNVHFGFTGLLNFGQAVFMAAGAYGLAMMVATIGPAANRNFGWNLSEGTLFWLGIFVGVIVFPVIFALIMGIPTLRLRADYLAIVTIAVAEIFRIVVRSPTPGIKKWTNSSDGLTGFSGTFYDMSPFGTQDRYLFNLFTGNQMFL